MENALEIIRLYSLCEATRWAHLVVSGGWYNQAPAFIDELMVIFDVRNEYERTKAAPSPHTQQAGVPWDL